MSWFVRLAFLVSFIEYGVFAQSSNWTLTCTLGDTLSHVELLRLSGDTLVVLHNGQDRLIAVGSITEVRHVEESAIWETAKKYGLVAGIVGGVVAGVAIAVSAHGSPFLSIDIPNSTAKILGVLIGVPFYGGVSAILGGIVGTVVGIVRGADDVYDLSGLTLKGKVVTLQGILNQGP